ncbi:MAG: class I SAM-dependent methyltransferase [Spirochaetales bacterium]|jgi:2-polyprenyl-6-hydroxyphenyl methylase/3-demethylubiquinone-9 3-methyltransferase|nr:class I SAM-dependent methyltransferase [Spirochaetales bacterium]
MSQEEKHYEFGKNWKRFLSLLSEERIGYSEKSLIEYLGADNFAGRRFLDIGSGSGIFSLCAKRLGAAVHSFDYDEDSVNCTRELQRKYFPQSREDGSWIIEQGSVLDEAHMEKFKDFDIVYSWGVLHHTGDMEKAFRLASKTVKPGGILFISIYNDIGWKTKLWKKIKKAYNKTPKIFRWIFVAGYIAGNWMPRMLRNTLRHANPFYSFTRRKKSRGMSELYDTFDWLGGYPYETARCGEVLAKFRTYGFELIKLNDSNGGLGCNEFVFVRKA